MNIEEYAQSLRSKEWQDKREAILKRDDYTCQKCGRRGFSYRSFKISGYSELDDLMKECSVDGQSISTFLKSVEWKDKTYIPMKDFETKYVKGKRWIVSFKDDSNERPFSFAADDYPIHPSYIKYEKQDLKVWHNHFNGNYGVRFYAFKLFGYYGHSNYVLLSKDNGDISIYINGIFFCFKQSKLGIFRYIAFNFATLHVHHKLYIENREPWQYKDENLITLCSDCHAEIHKTETTPLLSETGRVIYSDLPICDRCDGRGELPQYKYYMNGICFKCHGTGVLLLTDNKQ